jgi:two-component system LytT family response regulator
MPKSQLNISQTTLLDSSLEDMLQWSELKILSRFLSFKENTHNQTITVKDNQTIHLLPLDNVVLIEARSNYSTIVLETGYSFFTSKTLKYWIEKIGYQHPDFERVHRSFLVNRKHILAYKPKDKILILNGDRTVKVARNYKLIF